MLLFPSLAPPLATLQTGAGIYFTRGKKKKKPFSDHPHALKAPPEPYGKGSSAPAITPMEKQRDHPAHPVINSTWMWGLSSNPSGKARSPGRGKHSCLRGLSRGLSCPGQDWHHCSVMRMGSTSGTAHLAQHRCHGTSGTAPPVQHPWLLFRWPWSPSCLSRAPLPSWPCSTQQTPNSHVCSSLNHALSSSFI